MNVIVEKRIHYYSQECSGSHSNKMAPGNQGGSLHIVYTNRSTRWHTLISPVSCMKSKKINSDMGGNLGIFWKYFGATATSGIRVLNHSETLNRDFYDKEKWWEQCCCVVAHAFCWLMISSYCSYEQVRVKWISFTCDGGKFLPDGNVLDVLVAAGSAWLLLLAVLIGGLFVKWMNWTETSWTLHVMLLLVVPFSITLLSN